MKKLNVAKKDACMACKACEIACSEAFAYSAENAQKSVRRVPSLRIQRAYT